MRGHTLHMFAFFDLPVWTIKNLIYCVDFIHLSNRNVITAPSIKTFHWRIEALLLNDVPKISSSHRQSVPNFHVVHASFYQSHKRLCQSIIEMRIVTNIRLIQKPMNKRVHIFHSRHSTHSHKRITITQHKIYLLRILLVSRKKTRMTYFTCNAGNVDEWKRLISLHYNNLVRVPENFALCIFAFHI